MKKNLLITTVVLVSLAILGGAFFIFARSKNNQPVAEQPVEEGKYLETAFEDRPFVSLTPRTDGKELTLEIANIKNAETIDYELVYLAEGGLSRGVIGSIKNPGETSEPKTLLLGSCSRNVCKYDEGVNGGTLTLKFRSPEGVRKFDSVFALQKGGDELTLDEGEFSLSGTIPTTTYFVVMSTIGLPEPIDGGLVAGPFGVFSSQKVIVKGGKLVLPAPAEENQYQALIWNGETWNELTPVKEAISGKIGFGTTAIGTFVLVKTPTETQAE
jgi:hypothetical protein